MATSARILCVNEPLCFLTKKFDRYGIKQIKSLLFDFYSGDVLVNAKDVLINAIISQKIELPKTIAVNVETVKNLRRLKFVWSLTILSP